MKLDWKLFLVVIASLVLLVGCESTADEVSTPAFEVLTDYMVDNGLDADAVVSGWIVGADAVNGDEDSYFIVDIRTSDAFNTGHIPGAVNTTLAEVVNTVDQQNSSAKPVLVVCYTGQTAAHAVVGLRLSGYADAKVLKFGMSSWNSDFDSWTGNVGNIGIGNANWSMDAAPDFGNYGDPEIATEATEGAAILAERIAVVLGGFNGIDASDVLDTPANYQIMNYWGAEDYNGYGHIAGAYQLTPGTLTIANDGLKILDPEAINVIYCWTGQTSSMMTAWLKALGYDAKSLKFGANGMIYDNLQAHKWSAPFDYGYE